MSDPIQKPIPEDDKVYQDLGAPNYQRIPNAKQLQADAIKRQQDRERNDLLHVLKSAEGQSLVLRLLGFCGVYQTTEASPVAEGRRQVGLRLISIINDADPEMYPKLLQEHLKRQRTYAATEAAIAENHRRNAGGLRRVVTQARNVIRSTARSLADKVW